MPIPMVTSDTTDHFALPPTPAGRRRRLARRAVAGAAAAVLLATTVWAGWLLTVHSCRGFGWPDSALSRTNGECIGWTDEEAFTFGMPGLTRVTNKIAAENRDVRSRGRRPTACARPSATSGRSAARRSRS